MRRIILPIQILLTAFVIFFSFKLSDNLLRSSNTSEGLLKSYRFLEFDFYKLMFCYFLFFSFEVYLMNKNKKQNLWNSAGYLISFNSLICGISLFTIGSEEFNRIGLLVVLFPIFLFLSCLLPTRKNQE